MSLLFRLAGKGLRPQLLKPDSGRVLNYIKTVSVKCTPAVAPKNESHDERNMRLGRPQSPHLTIYKPQLTTLLSISHRATGIILAGYTILFSMLTFYLPCPIEYYIEQIQCAELGRGIIYGIKFMLVFPLTYHYWNGVRHLLWDTGRFLTIREVYATGWTMLSLAIASAVLISGLSGA